MEKHVMLSNDKQQFAELLNSTADFYGKKLSAMHLERYFKTLAHYPINAIELAIQAHDADAERGRFMPLPADLIGHLEKMRFDDRPSAEEAWSTAVQAVDERVTVVWTEETKLAWDACASELMAIGDKFNASRGFIAKYNDLVSLARLQGKPVVWLVAQGYDKDLREQAIRDAHKAKKITTEYAKILLPYHKAEEGALAAIESNVALMIENKGATANHKQLSRLDELKKAGELHQQRIATLKNAIGDKEHKKQNSPRECLAIFEKAEALNVFSDNSDKKHWLEVAGNGGNMNELQQRILAKRSQRGAA